MSQTVLTGSAGGHWGILYLLGVPFRTRFNEKRMNALRDRRLRWLVRHAARTIPFYRELLQRSGVEPGSIHGFGDIERLPQISRQALREAGATAWSNDLPASRLYQGAEPQSH